MRKKWVGGLGGDWKGHGRAGHSGKSRERREVIGGAGLSGEEGRDRREVIGGGGFLGKKSGRKGGKW